MNFWIFEWNLICKINIIDHNSQCFSALCVRGFYIHVLVKELYYLNTAFQWRANAPCPTTERYPKLLSCI